jgi:hypothetical protein
MPSFHFLDADDACALARRGVRDASVSLAMMMNKNTNVFSILFVSILFI